METQLDGSSDGGQYSESKQPESPRKRSVAFVARGSQLRARTRRTRKPYTAVKTRNLAVKTSVSGPVIRLFRKTMEV